MDVEQLRAVVAEFYNVPPDAVSSDFALSTPERQGSIARYALDALLRRRVGIQSRTVYTAKTYGELEAALTGSEAPTGPRPTAVIPVGDAEVACGVDIEMVKNLPVADDYFSHPFYETHFTLAEIAYCTAQENPPMHFAARWCAKEALKKCAPALLDADMNTLEVAANPDRVLRLRHVVGEEAQDLPYAVSLTHTPQFAAAIVVSRNGARPAPPPPPSPGPPPAPPKTPSRGGGLALGVAVLALLLALIALVRAW